MNSAATSTEPEIFALAGLSKSAQAFSRVMDLVKHELTKAAGTSTTELRADSPGVRDAGHGPKQLADFLAMTMPAVTSITTSLVDRGLIERRPDAVDRRRLILELTPDGREVVERVYASFDDAIASATRGMSSELKQQIADGLETITGELAGRS
jgi:DNA-binding MarR family transcriptional regulator